MTKSPLRVQEVRAARFRDVSRSAGSHFERALIGRGAATGDIDNDGDLDLVISNVAGPAVVLRNDTTGGHWLRLVLRDRGPNQEAIGARVWVEAGGRTQYREVHGGGGYLSANDRRLHVGLGGTTTVDRIRHVARRRDADRPGGLSGSRAPDRPHHSVNSAMHRSGASHARRHACGDDEPEGDERD